MDKIFLINFTPFFGGGEMYLVRLTALLCQENEITLISPALSSIESEMRRFGAKIWSLKTGGLRIRINFLFLLLFKRSIFRSRSGSTIILNGRGAAFFAPVVYLLLGVKPVIISHTALTLRTWDVKEVLFGLAAKFSKVVVAVSEFTALQHKTRWPRLDVVAIPNWIDGQKFEPKNRNLVRSVVSPEVALVSRLVPDKGIEDVLEIFASQKGVTLHIYGDGPLGDALKSQYANNPVLKFHGFLDDLNTRLPRHDILLSASYSESFSYSVVEGILSGLLCVVSDIAAHRELLGNDYPEELFFKPGDLMGLRNSLETAMQWMLVDNSNLVQRIISSASDRVHQRNSPKIALENYFSVLKK